MEEIIDHSKIYSEPCSYYTPWTPKTLHERMMVEAEPVVKHNWLDVALHDKIKIEKAPCNHVYLWILTEVGSHLMPLYCEAKEGLKIKGTQYTYISHNVFRFFTRNNTTPFCNLSDHSYYFVIKRNTLGGGDIIPVGMEEIIHFISFGRWMWTDGVGLTYTASQPT